MPAEQLLIKGMLNREQLVSNAGLMTAIDQSVKILAPLAISVLAGWWAPNLGFAISFVIAAVGARGRRHPEAEIRCAPPVGPTSTARQSFATLKVMVIEDVYFRVGLCASLLQSFVLGLYDPMLTIILKHQGLAPGAFGVVVSATALGALIGAILFKRVFKREGGLSLIALSLSGFGASVFVPGLIGALDHHLPLLGFAVLWIINGLCYALTAMNFFGDNTDGDTTHTDRCRKLDHPFSSVVFSRYCSVSWLCSRSARGRQHSLCLLWCMTLLFAAGLGWWSSVRSLSSSPKA